jgi:methionyl-tRNA formyltransferase
MGYPLIVPSTTLRIAPAGAVNVHGSLLPRHRGILPLFWIYYHDDRETGVTVHRATEQADAGDILGQRAFPLPRGYSVGELNRRNGRVGAELLRDVLGRIERGAADGVPQDERRATLAPGVPPGTPMVRFGEWDVERVWHFCAGLNPWFREPLRTAGGRAVRYSAVLGFERRPSGLPPGTVEQSDAGYILHCIGGLVRLAP